MIVYSLTVRIKSDQDLEERVKKKIEAIEVLNNLDFDDRSAKHYNPTTQEYTIHYRCVDSKDLSWIKKGYERITPEVSFEQKLLTQIPPSKLLSEFLLLIDLFRYIKNTRF